LRRSAAMSSRVNFGCDGRVASCLSVGLQSRPAES
jgi:hypothetical protein